MAADQRVAFAIIAEHLGLAATVTRPPPEDMPLPATIVWEPTREQLAPGGTAIQRQDGFRVMAIARADVPTVPRGTLVHAPALVGAPIKRWRVDTTERVDDDHVRVAVVEDPEP